MSITPEQIDIWRAANREHQNLEFKAAKTQFDSLSVANSYSESIPANFARKNLPLSQRKPRDSRTSRLVQESENISPIRRSNSANIPLPFAIRYRANSQLLSELNLSKFELSALLTELLVNCHRNQRKRYTDFWGTKSFFHKKATYPVSESQGNKNLLTFQRSDPTVPSQNGVHMDYIFWSQNDI
jgi:hypothetical protein